MTDLRFEALLNLLGHLTCCFWLPLWVQRRLPVREAGEKIFLALVALILAVHPISAFASFLSRGNPDVIFAVAMLTFLANSAWQSPSLRQRNLSRILLVIAVCLFASQTIYSVLTKGAPQFDGIFGFVAAIGHSIVAMAWPWSSAGVRGFAYTTCPEGVVLDRLALLLGWGVIVGTVALTVATVMRRRLQPWLVEVAWFVLPLMLVIIGTPDGAFAVEERRLYVPLIGMCSLVARPGLHAMRKGVVARTSVLLVTTIVVIVLAISTVAYVKRRQDPYTLLLFQYQTEPKNPVYARQLSEELIRTDQRSRALAILRRGYHDAERRCDYFAEAELALLAMEQMVHLAPDLDQAQLMSLRAAYDRLLVEGELELHLADLKLELPKWPTQRVIASDAPKFVALPRAVTYMRTMELSTAEQQLVRLTQRDRTKQDAWGLLALVYARQSKWPQLDRLLPTIARLPQRGPALQDVVHRVTRARALAQTLVQGEVSTAIRDAQVQLILHAPEAARRLLDPAFQWTPTHRELVLTYAQTYIDDRRRDLAVQLIQRTGELDPRQADFWRQALFRVKTHPPTQ